MTDQSGGLPEEFKHDRTQRAAEFFGDDPHV